MDDGVACAEGEIRKIKNFQLPTPNSQAARSRDNELLGSWKLDVGNWTFKSLFDSLIYGLVTGGIFAWLWPR